MRRLIFVMALLISWLIPAKGQQPAPGANGRLYSVDTAGVYGRSPYHLHLYSGNREKKYPSRSSFLPLYAEKTPNSKPGMIAPDFYYTHCYGFFCKLEWVTQDRWHIPLSLRLGSYRYEKGLEGEE